MSRSAQPISVYGRPEARLAALALRHKTASLEDSRR